MACIENSPTVALSLDGGNLKADAVVSPDAGNSLSAHGNGLYAALGSTVIFDHTVSGAPAAVVDSNAILGGDIPGSWSELELSIRARSDSGGLATNLTVTINNDGGATYCSLLDYIDSAGLAAVAESIASVAGMIGQAPGVNTGSNMIAAVTFPNYSASDTRHEWMSDFYYSHNNSAGTLRRGHAGGFYTSGIAVPITRLAFKPAAGAFVVGSRFILRGRL